MDGLQYEIYEELKKTPMRVTAAESCTGGMIASSLIDVPGISAFLKESYVTYSNEAKERILGVDPQIIETYTVESMETAIAMARGAALRANADVSIATTGIAGPDGAREGKPVGYVAFGIYYKGKTKGFEFVFDGDRMSVRRQATTKALALLLDAINTEKEIVQNKRNDL